MIDSTEPIQLHGGKLVDAPELDQAAYAPQVFSTVNVIRLCTEWLLQADMNRMLQRLSIEMYRLRPW